MTEQWDGRPQNPERDGRHWVDGPENKNPVVLIWHTLTQNWVLGAIGLPPSSLAGAIYLGPALTPAEVEAREAAARREGIEVCAALVGDLPLPHPDTGTWFVDGARMMRENARHRIRALQEGGDDR